MNSEDRGDYLLIEEIKCDNLNAMSKIIQKYQKPFYNLAYRIVLNHEDAEDVVQDSFVKIFEKADSYKNTYRFYSWASSIVVNTSINKKKKDKIRLKYFNRIIKNKNYNNNSSKLLKEVITKDKANIVEKLLKKISFEYRIVLILRAYEGLSYEEIAKRLGISPGTVMYRISRGRKKLLFLLNEYN